MLFFNGTHIKVTRKNLFNGGICLYQQYGVILNAISVDSKYNCYKIRFIDGHKANAYENEFRVVSREEFKIAQVMES